MKKRFTRDLVRKLSRDYDLPFAKLASVLETSEENYDVMRLEIRPKIRAHARHRKQLSKMVSALRSIRRRMHSHRDGALTYVMLGEHPLSLIDNLIGGLERAVQDLKGSGGSPGGSTYARGLDLPGVRDFLAPLRELWEEKHGAGSFKSTWKHNKATGQDQMTSDAGKFALECVRGLHHLASPQTVSREMRRIRKVART